MAPKRKKSHGDGNVESQDESAANPGDTSTSDFAKTVYLVAEHEGEKTVYLVAEHEGEKTAYSVFKVEVAGGGDGGGTKRPRVHTVAGLPNTARGTSFVSVRSKHGAWIVGVGGGLRAGTTIFDPSTLKTYRGPQFPHPKRDPVLLSLAGEIYALSRRPRVVPVPDIDFEPWFHSLSFNNEIPIGGGVGRTYWCRLPPPPFFPAALNPYQFRNPPEISVTSYAAVGSSHILLSGVSAQQEEPIDLGTYAFHVMNKTWEKVHDENLPFIGQAMPLGGGGGNLFVACPVSKENNGATAASVSLFHISIEEASSSTPMLHPALLIKKFPMPSPSLLIQELLVKASESEGRIPKPLLCPLGKGSFCSIMLGASLRKEDQVILTEFQIENIDAILNACQSVGTDAKNLQVAVQVKEQVYAYKSKGLDSDMPIVAAPALSMPADADQSDADQQVRVLDRDSKESRDRSAYLVAAHWDCSRSYSVFKMVDLAASSASKASRKRLKRLGSLKADTGRNKVFTSVSSRNRAWIIGVGGLHRDTIIFDTSMEKKKKEKVIQGPNINSAKRSPVLTTVGDKVYAMSKFPSWVSDPDFPPWFEVLDLSKAKIVNVAGKLHLEDCSWTPLPHPPCMPWELSPRQYTMLPMVNLMSCVVVGPYILISFNYPWGTYAFDTNAQEPYKWHKVDKDNLPFIGCATPLGSIFLASSRKGPISAYRIHVAKSDDEDNALKLSITVLPVKYMEREVNVEPCFSSLDNESFCSLSLSIDSDSLTYKHETGKHFPRQVHVNLTTYQIENPSVLENRDKTMLTVNSEVAVSSQQECTLNIASSTHGFSPSGFSLVSM